MTSALVRRTVRLLVLALASPVLFFGYSVLSHEAIVDSVWDNAISKVLLERFPEATPQDLERAHAYTYGGAIIQDLGYYPFSSHLFSDLTHYVRSGDFVVALLRESGDLDEYAFALGALAHYAADNSGHRLATNLAVPILYPELRKRFGRVITYWDNPLSHLRTEFGFDVLQVAQGRYAPDQYRSFIGFEVSKPLLERAFQDTYSLEMKDIFGSLDLALGSFRYTVSSIIPGMTRVAWQLRREVLIREIPGVTRKKFLFNLSRSSYEKKWGRGYRRPGFRSRLVTCLLRLVPKWGPFRSLAFRAPTPEVQRLFMASFNATVENYQALLTEQKNSRLVLRNENFDLGAPSLAGQYQGADNAYDTLLHKLAERKFQGISEELRTDMLTYYVNRKLPVRTAKVKSRGEWERTVAERSLLEAAVPLAPPPPDVPSVKLD